MTSEQLVSLLVAMGAGGVITTIVNYFLNRKAIDFNLFYPTWKEEMERMRTEISYLRQDVVALSKEIHRLGGDPTEVRLWREG